MSLLGLGGFKNNGLGLATIPFDRDGPSDLLAFQKDLGVTLQDKRSTATIEAFQNPAKALADYQRERVKLDGMALGVYKTAGKQAQDSGLSQDVAMQYARKRAFAYHEAELELLNLTHPFAESPEGLVALASGAKRADLLKK